VLVPGDLRGKSAIVCGAGAGWGQEVALALARQGVAVVACDINIERADRSAEQIAMQGGTAFAMQADLSNRFQAASMIESARDRCGRIHILVNASSIWNRQPMLQIDEWSWRRQLELNITAAFFCMQLLGRVMADEGGGVMLHITGQAGGRGIGYRVGTAALHAMTEQSAQDLEAQRIRVNALVLPPDAAPAEYIERALFLCSDAAAGITGAIEEIRADAKTRSP